MKHSLTTAAVKAAVFVFLISALLPVTFAQVEVVESNPIIRPLGQTPTVNSNTPGNPTSNPLDDLFQQIQTLQLQVQQQTGLIEELNYEIQRLKQQRLDDYVDLDRRISELQGTSPASTPRTTPPPSNPGATRGQPPANPSPTNSASGAVDNRDETAAYRAATPLINDQKWDEAIATLQGYLNDFPNGRYESDAHFWIGELYFVKGNLESARNAYQVVLNRFPNSNRFHASQYKLARTLFRLGEKERSKTLLEELAATNSDSSRQAAVFLRENFP